MLINLAVPKVRGENLLQNSDFSFRDSTGNAPRHWNKNALSASYVDYSGDSVLRLTYSAVSSPTEFSQSRADMQYAHFLPGKNVVLEGEIMVNDDGNGAVKPFINDASGNKFGSAIPVDVGVWKKFRFATVINSQINKVGLYFDPLSNGSYSVDIKWLALRVEGYDLIPEPTANRFMPTTQLVVYCYIPATFLGIDDWNIPFWTTWYDPFGAWENNKLVVPWTGKYIFFGQVATWGATVFSGSGWGNSDYGYSINGGSITRLGGGWYWGDTSNQYVITGVYGAMLPKTGGTLNANNEVRFYVYLNRGRYILGANDEYPTCFSVYYLGP